MNRKFLFIVSCFLFAHIACSEKLQEKKLPLSDITPSHSIFIRNISGQEVTVVFNKTQHTILDGYGISVSQNIYNQNPLPNQLPHDLTTIFEEDGWCDITQKN